jgi:hypothetical protein
VPAAPLRVALLTDAFARRNGEIVDGVANTLHREPSRKRRMGEAARRFALTRSWSSVFDRLLEEYLTVVAAAQPAPPASLARPLPAPAPPAGPGWFETTGPRVAGIRRTGSGPSI